MVYACPKCSKTYKFNNGWMRKHMITKCHVMHLTPIELAVKDNVNLTEILRRITNLETMIKKGKIMNKYHDTPIERIKAEEESKIIDPSLREYRKAFGECITELREVLKLRKEQLDNQVIGVEQLQLIEVMT